MRFTLGCLVSLLLITLVATPATAADEPLPQWRQLPNAPQMGQGSRHDDIFFLDDVTGWVCNLSGDVYKTTNGGVSWVQQVDEFEAFRSIAFANHERGWLGSVFSVNLLFETFDGGESWSVVPNLPEPRPTGICGLWPVNENVIYGCGKYSGPAIFIKSIDGGNSWTATDLAPLADTLVDCHFVNENEGFLVGGFGAFQSQTRAVVLHTLDGGETWNPRYFGPYAEEWGWKISFPSPQVGYVSLENSHGLPDAFLKTTNGGLTWTRTAYVNNRQQGVGFVNENVGWIGGDLSFAYETRDGGSTWDPTTWGAMLNRVWVIREDLAYAVGQGVYKYSRLPAPTSTPTPRSPVVLEQNYPNPFNPTTLIKYYLNEDGPVSLVVYNASGEQVRTLMDDYLPEGDYEVVWDAKDDAGRGVASGLYFCRLESGTFAEVKKMSVIK